MSTLVSPLRQRKDTTFISPIIDSYRSQVWLHRGSGQLVEHSVVAALA
jgi:hypothetical protein